MSLQGQAVLYSRMVNFLILGALGCQTGRAGPTEGDNRSAQTGQCYERHLALGPATHKSHSPVRPQCEDASCLLIAGEYCGPGTSLALIYLSWYHCLKASRTRQASGRTQ